MSEAHVYRPRTYWLPDPRQTYLHLASVRPHFGACPSCGVPEEVYCSPDCDLVDPFGHSALHLLGRCRRCAHIPTTTARAPGLVLVLPYRRVRHLVTPGSTEPLCQASHASSAVVYRGAW